MNNPTPELKPKLLGLEQLQLQMDTLHMQGKRIVHCHGVFDLLHIGHIRHFKQARQLGDVLVVTITGDKFVNKGPGRPEFTELLRAEAIAALQCVEFVAINQNLTAVPAIQAIRPNLHVKGSEYVDRLKDPTSRLHLEKAATEACGGKLIFTDDIQFSSSHLLNKFLSGHSVEISRYLENLRLLFSADDAVSQLKKLGALKVLVIGEAIIGHYQASSSQLPFSEGALSLTRPKAEQVYLGGSLAIGNHVAGFASRVKVISCIGEQERDLDKIVKRLKPNVKTEFLTLKNRSTVRKLRYVDCNILQKIFTTRDSAEDAVVADESLALLQDLEHEVIDYDLVIIADYGHGMLNNSVIKMLCEKARFLAVNAQFAVGNMGLHASSDYPKADFVLVSAGELQIDLGLSDAALPMLGNAIRSRIPCPLLSISQGGQGMTTQYEDRPSESQPRVRQIALDRIWAGDAIFALTSMLACTRAPREMLVFLGQLADSEFVRTEGPNASLELDSIKRMLIAILK